MGMGVAGVGRNGEAGRADERVRSLTGRRLERWCAHDRAPVKGPRPRPLHRGRQMTAHRRLCGGRIAPLDRREHRLMLGLHGQDAGGRRAAVLERALAHWRHADWRRERSGNGRNRDCARPARWWRESDCRPRYRLPAPVMAIFMSRRRRASPPVRCGWRGRRQAGRGAFHRDAELKDVVQIPDDGGIGFQPEQAPARLGRNEGAEPLPRIDQFIRLQPRHRLAHHHPRDVEPLGQLLLGGQPCTRAIHQSGSRRQAGARPRRTAAGRG